MYLLTVQETRSSKSGSQQSRFLWGIWRRICSVTPLPSGVAGDPQWSLAYFAWPFSLCPHVSPWIHLSLHILKIPGIGFRAHPMPIWPHHNLITSADKVTLTGSQRTILGGHYSTHYREERWHYNKPFFTSPWLCTNANTFQVFKSLQQSLNFFLTRNVFDCVLQPLTWSCLCQLITVLFSLGQWLPNLLKRMLVPTPSISDSGSRVRPRILHS